MKNIADMLKYKINQWVLLHCGGCILSRKYFYYSLGFANWLVILYKKIYEIIVTNIFSFLVQELQTVDCAN